MDLASLTPLEGGRSGRTFVGETASERVVVRVYPPGLRPDAAPEVDADLLALVHGLLPVPDVLEVRRGDAAVPGLLITSWVEGERGDLLLPRLDDDGLRRAGESLGMVAAVLAGMPAPRAGVVVEDLPSWVAERLGPVPSWAGLLDTATLQVTAVLDWELARAGHPFADLGHLLRLERSAPYVDGVLDAWRSRHDGEADDVVLLARSADLRALVDLAARRGQHPAADHGADHADALLRSIASTRDVSAPGVPRRLDAVVGVGVVCDRV